MFIQGGVSSDIRSENSFNSNELVTFFLQKILNRRVSCQNCDFKVILMSYDNTICCTYSQRKLLASCIKPLVSCIKPLASCIKPLASCINLLASCIKPLASCINLLASCIKPLASWTHENIKYVNH